MKEGWVCFYRKITEWEWYSTPNMLHLFFHMIVSANHKDGKWKGVDIKRGQLATGRKALSAAIGVSEQSIRTCLARLERTGEITQKPTSKFSIITICNYDDYQEDKKQINQQLTSNQPATNQQLTTNNNENNVTKKTNVEKKPRQDIPFLEIVSFLNQKIGKNYRATTNGTKSHIKARFNEGFTLSDFKTVIKNMSLEWSGDPKMEKYLRPETLFGSKFDSYLQLSQGQSDREKWDK